MPLTLAGALGYETPADLRQSTKSPVTGAPQIDLPQFVGAVDSEFKTPREVENVKIIEGARGRFMRPAFDYFHIFCTTLAPQFLDEFVPY